MSEALASRVAQPSGSADADGTAHCGSAADSTVASRHAGATDQAADGAYVVGWWNADAEVTDAPQMMFWLGGCDFRKM